MPKMSDRERLADLAEKSRKIADEMETTQRRLRERYGAIVIALPVEDIAERDFREGLALLLRLGGPPAIAAMKAALPKG